VSIFCVEFRPTTSESSAFTVEPVDSSLTFVNRLAYNSDDGLYAVGSAPKDPLAKNTVDLWCVRKSSAQSQGNANTWIQEDTFALGKSAFSTANGITRDADGYVYVCGVASDGRTPHLVVRRRAPAGGWLTVLDAKGSNNSMAPSMCSFPGDATHPPAVLVVSELNSKWTVLRSEQHGDPGTWLSVDNWTSSQATAYDAVYDSVRGIIYVVGCRGLNGSNPSAWVIRMSDDGGKQSWKRLLDQSGQGSWSSRATADAAGNVSVSGVVRDTTGTIPLWRVIRCTNPQDPTSWLNSFNAGLLPFGSTYSKGRGIVAADASGNLFVAGEVVDWTDNSSTPAATYSSNRVGLLRIIP
jgi:hypothetical protein